MKTTHHHLIPKTETLRPALERANLLPKAQKASEPKADK